MRVEEIEFAQDSPLEQRRFELMVPPRTPAFRARRTTLAFDRQAALAKLFRITQSDANLGFGRCGGITLLLS